MISLIDTLPQMSVSAQSIKIACLYDCYSQDDKVLFWSQDGGRAVIAMTDGNMMIHNSGGDLEELKEFCNVISPACVFSDYDTLCGIGRKPQEKINIMSRYCDVRGETEGDSLSSKEIYDLLNVEGLSLPEYPYFAVDYCRRLNRHSADYFAIKDTCAVITFNSGESAIINGIASHKKGYGSVALKAIMQKNHSRQLFVCCRERVKGFYEKNGFKPLYYGGYWVKEF